MAGLDVDGEEFDPLFGIINRFIGYFTIESQQKSQNDAAKEYPFVPMDTRQMFQEIQVAADYLRQRGRWGKADFIDIGCGIGNVLLVAEELGFRVRGIEKDPHPCAIAQKLIGVDKVSQEDIWAYDGFHNFDVIYYFRPFHDGESQRRFERLIEDSLKRGGVLIANRKMSREIEEDRRFQRLHPRLPVWVKDDYKGRG